LSGLEEVEIEATVNGKAPRRRVKARQHLADFLRQDLELTGTHLGCEHGICGACTVLVDNRTVRGCLTLAAQISGTETAGRQGAAPAVHPGAGAGRHRACSPTRLISIALRARIAVFDKRDETFQ
jgi:2Fe-2S iron-sulfur cluster binding domain